MWLVEPGSNLPGRTDAGSERRVVEVRGEQKRSAYAGIRVYSSGVGSSSWDGSVFPLQRGSYSSKGIVKSGLSRGLSYAEQPS